MTYEEHKNIKVGTHFWAYDKGENINIPHIFKKEGVEDNDYFIAGSWEGGFYYVDLDFIEEIKPPNK